MEKLRDFVLHPHIHSALERWLEGIRKVQARRKEEIVNATNRHRNVGNRHQEDKGTSGLLSRSVFIHLVAGDPMIVSPLDTIYIFDKDTWMRLPNKRACILLVFWSIVFEYDKEGDRHWPWCIVSKFIVALLLVPSLFPGIHFVSIYCHIPVHAYTLTFIMKEHS